MLIQLQFLYFGTIVIIKSSLIKYFWSLSHLENDELSGSPDMSSPSQPLYLIPDNAVDEEHEEQGVDDEGALHDPHGDSVNVLQGRGCSGGVGGGQREGAGYEERK